MLTPKRVLLFTSVLAGSLLARKVVDTAFLRLTSTVVRDERRNR